MTVASLWKVLDKSGCGKAVGVSELTGGKSNNKNRSAEEVAASLRGVNPWNYNDRTHQAQNSNNNNNNNNNDPSSSSSSPSAKKKSITLAVDLSIWICESLTSHAIAENHSNPSLHLVFSRTVKLLTLGIGLVFVVEGKRRIRALDSNSNNNNNQEHQQQKQAPDKFHKRRSGTVFWKACRDCQEMLQLLSVPVVRAKAEGEALCALLNQRGIVDGVISNDGDCLLFGAKTVYTKFSIENLESSNIVRYDLDELLAVCDGSGDNDNDEENNINIDNNNGDFHDAAAAAASLKLSRTDLIAFALLTGSDLAGNGLPKVGHKKAIRFIRKCQQDNPLQASTAAIEELKSWARTAATTTAAPSELDGRQQKPKGTKCCSRCCHPGSKRSHEKHGCEACGTQPGEPCFEVTTEDRFRKTLRAKALEVKPKFEPSQVVAAYLRPNDNQIPAKLAGITPNRPLQMDMPNFASLMQMSHIVKGRSLEASREYLKQAVGRLLSRSELTRPTTSAGHDVDQPTMPRLSRERPVPQQITKELVQKQVPCYEVSWKVSATITNDDGSGIDGYEYSTIEPRDLVQERYPELVTRFKQEAKERQKQGDGEKMRRQNFLESLWIDVPLESSDPQEKGRGGGAAVAATEGAASVKEYRPSPIKRSKKRVGFFDEQHQQHQTKPRLEAELASDDDIVLKGCKPKRARARGGQDVGQLLRFVTTTNPLAKTLRGAIRSMTPFDHDSIETRSDDECLIVAKRNSKKKNRRLKKRRTRKRAYMKKPPGHEHLPAPGGPEPLFCFMGDFEIEITPLQSALRPGKFPPHHIFVRRQLGIDE